MTGDPQGRFGDSTRLVFYAGPDGSHRIWVVDLGDGTETQVGDGEGDEFWPSWSPDGQRVGFQRATKGARR